MLCRFSRTGEGTAATFFRVRQWCCPSRNSQRLSRVAAHASCFARCSLRAPAVAAAERPAFTASTLHISTRYFGRSAVRCAPPLASPSLRSRSNPQHFSKHRSDSRRSCSKRPSSHTKMPGRGSSSSRKSKRFKSDARAAEEVLTVDPDSDSEVTPQHRKEIDGDLFKVAEASSSELYGGDLGSESFANPSGAQAAHMSASLHSEREATQVQSEPGWSLETANATTGKTALEELYDRNLSRIHSILERPLPPMPPDGSVNPDFLVGFASYNYQLRDQYRAVIARELHVPVRAVRLSVAWSGRFNVKRFSRVQKVCGVCLDRTVVSHASEVPLEDRDSTDTDTHASTEQKSDTGRVPASGGLPDALQQRIAALISAINSNKREDLLNMQLFQASPPIPEVEFALSGQAHRLLYHLHEWIRRHVLQRAVAVVVYGVPPSPLPSQDLRTESKKPAAVAVFETDMHRRYELWRQKAIEASAAQYREVQSRWLRLFHRREVVPAVLSLTELATRLAIAVVDGDVSGVQLEKKDADPTDSNPVKQNEEEVILLNGPLRDLLMDMASVAAAPAAASSTAGGDQEADVGIRGLAGATGTGDTTDTVQPQRAVRAELLPRPTSAPNADLLTDAWGFSTAAQQEAALRWVQLVFQSLLLREAYSGQTTTSTGGGASASITTPSVALGVSLPALFAQGVYAGSRDEVAYLQHNRTAMDALLLHPHEISFKKKFVSRLRNGHRRPRMEAEAATPHSSGG